MERPDIPKYSTERQFLTIANYIFTFIFTMEMTVKVGGESFTSAPAFVHICPRPIYINFRLKSQSQFTSAPDSHPRVSSHQSQLVSFFCLTPVHINSRFKWTPTFVLMRIFCPRPVLMSSNLCSHQLPVPESTPTVLRENVIPLIQWWKFSDKDEDNGEKISRFGLTWTFLTVFWPPMISCCRFLPKVWW